MLVKLSFNPKTHQVIDIVVEDILESYGLLLSRDLSEKLNGYFATDWLSLWVPFRGQANMVKIDHENYMKHTVTKLDGTNEHVMFTHSKPGNLSLDSFFGIFELGELPLTQSST